MVSLVCKEQNDVDFLVFGKDVGLLVSRFLLIDTDELFFFCSDTSGCRKLIRFSFSASNVSFMPITNAS